MRNPSALWHLRHFNNPGDTSPGSIMPAYAHLIDQKVDFADAQGSVKALRAVGVPYDDATVASAAELARAQAARVQAQLIEENGRAEGVEGLERSKAIALIAYLQRLGTDLGKPVEVPADPDAAMGAVR